MNQLILYNEFYFGTEGVENLYAYGYVLGQIYPKIFKCPISMYTRTNKNQIFDKLIEHNPKRVFFVIRGNSR